MKVTLNTSDYRTTMDLPSGVELYTQESRISSNTISAINSARPSINVVDICFYEDIITGTTCPVIALSPERENDYLATLPCVKISLENIITYFSNTSRFKEKLKSSIEHAASDPGRLAFIQSIIPSVKRWELSNGIPPYMIYLTKGPRSTPILIGFKLNQSIYLYRHLFHLYLSATPGDLYNYNFNKLAGNLLNVLTQKIDTELTLGVDPELVLYESEDISPDEEGVIARSTDASQVLGNSDTFGSVGTDGCAALFEIRPKPEKDPKLLTEQIEKCLKILVGKIVTSKFVSMKQFFLEAGGGAHYSIGGHIHFGNEHFIRHPNYFMSKLGPMMDEFLYRPIRRRMYGAVRQWGSSAPCSAIFGTYLSELEKFAGAKKALIENMNNRAHDFPSRVEYDHAGQIRVQRHGLEYRSLPSFIASKDFTEIILTMAMGIGKLILNSVRDGKDIIYDKPVTEEGYLLFTTPDIFKRFMRYINGEKRNLFFQNTVRGWGIKPERYGHLSISTPHHSGESERMEPALHDVSLQLNEAIADTNIARTVPIHISLDILNSIERDPLGQKSIGIFIAPDALHRVIIYRQSTLCTADHNRIARYAAGTLLSRDDKLHITLNTNIPTESTEEIRDEVVAHVIFFIDRILYQSSLQKKSRVIDTLLRKFPSVKNSMATLSCRLINPSTVDFSAIEHTDFPSIVGLEGANPVPQMPSLSVPDYIRFISNNEIDPEEGR
jgi:hypothetical protein